MRASKQAKIHQYWITETGFSLVSREILLCYIMKRSEGSYDIKIGTTVDK